MSQSSNTSLALHEILLGIADSLNQAQQQLRNMPPYDEYGRPNTMYQLPYLDFSLQVTSDFESTTQTTNTKANPSLPVMPAIGNIGKVQSGLIRFNPQATIPTSTNQKSHIASTISGRFVAVLPNEGLPQVNLTVATQGPEIKGGIASFTITVSIANTLNEKFPNTTVEFNFDVETSQNINGVIVTPPVFSSMEGKTNLNGELTTTINLNINDYNNGRTFLIRVNSGSVSKSIAISKT
ncbi:hypothetical protein [Flavobacterium cheongpyeongense]|nr:hypothetical protein [Flavobacterium cheongpyeongense]